MVVKIETFQRVSFEAKGTKETENMYFLCAKESEGKTRAQYVQNTRYNLDRNDNIRRVHH